MIQDINPHRFSNEYIPIPPEDTSYFLYFRDDEILVHIDDNEIAFPMFRDISKTAAADYKNCTYLFSVDAHRFYLIDELYTDFPENFHMEKIQIFRKSSPRWAAFAGVTGHHLYDWYESHHYCGRCGSPFCHSHKERCLVCDNCGLREYPRISPAVIVALTNKDKLLMSRYAGRGRYKSYALIAGFTEIGETVEDTVRREVYEEVGLHVKNLRYYKSQPWAFTDSLLMGFFAELDGSDEIRLDTNELATAGWFSREEIPHTQMDISLTSEMIMAFKHKLF